MADTTYAYTPGSGALASIDRISTTDYPHYKIKWGPGGTVNDVDITTGKPFPIQLRGSDGTDRSNLLPVSITGTPAVSISGTPAVSQSGTWNINTVTTLPAVVQGAAGASAWKVDGSAVTQPISHAGIPTALGAHSAMKIEGVASGTLVPVTQDPTQLGTLVNSSVPVITGGFLYQPIPAGTTTAVVLGTTGAIGDYLEHIIAIVTNPSLSGVAITDGVGGTLNLLPNGVAGGVGTYHVALGIRSLNGGWFLSTQAGVEVIATGRWT